MDKVGEPGEDGATKVLSHRGTSVIVVSKIAEDP